MSGKQRLSVSVDADLVAAGERAVAHDRAPTMSAWVNDALRLKVEHDRRLDALAEFVADYEEQHGEITDAEMRDAVRHARARAVAARALVSKKRAKSGRRT